MNDLHIWGRMSSINVRKVVLCAQWLGLPFKRTDAGLAYGIVKTPEYLRMNPNAQVPVLQDGGVTLWESNVIVRYLCATYSLGDFYPENLAQRFDAERWMDWQQTTLNSAGRDAFVQWIRTPADQRSMPAIEKSVAATQPLLAMLDAHLSQHAFMGGARMTMVDFPIACEMHRWWGLPADNPTRPRASYVHLDRWYARICAHPASHGVLDVPLN
jgi:glutathione S-transferase